jgi:hypothetical protein
MPMQKTTAKVNLSSSLKAHATDPTEQKQDFSKLPGGITGGVARLIAAKRGIYQTGNNKGQQFIRMAATVLEPSSVMVSAKSLVDGINPKTKKPGKVLSYSKPQEVKIYGLQTSVMLPLCETKKSNGEVVTADENIAAALNELRLIGGSECTAGVDSEEALDNLLQELVNAKPCIRFSTNAPDPTEEYPEPRTFERWYGAVENYESNGQAEASAIQDNTAGGATTTASESTESEGESEGEATTTSEEVDLDSLTLAELAELADPPNSNEQAALKLQDLALENGVSETAIQESTSYADVVTLIEEAVAAAEAPQDETPVDPEKGAVFSYKPVDLRTKKPGNKVVDVEVTSVNKKDRTVSLVNLANKKLTYNKVSWDSLEPPTTK